MPRVLWARRGRQKEGMEILKKKDKSLRDSCGSAGPPYAAPEILWFTVPQPQGIIADSNGACADPDLGLNTTQSYGVHVLTL